MENKKVYRRWSIDLHENIVKSEHYYLQALSSYFSFLISYLNRYELTEKSNYPIEFEQQLRSTLTNIEMLYNHIQEQKLLYQQVEIALIEEKNDELLKKIERLQRGLMMNDIMSEGCKRYCWKILQRMSDDERKRIKVILNDSTRPSLLWLK